MKKTLNKKNIQQKSTGGAIAGGAASGAATGMGIGATVGSIVPVYGTAAGAALGSIFGAGIGAYQGFKKNKADQAQLKSTENNLKAQRLENEFNQNYKPQFAAGYYAMANGGQVPQPNAMVDNNEIVQTNGPVNQLAQSLGGGMMNPTSSNTAQVQGSNPNQTDGVAAQIEPGSRVFSDKIKTSNGKTFAKEADKLSKEKSKYEKLANDKDAGSLRRKTANMMIGKMESQLDRLFEEQESLKQEKYQSSVDRAQKKYGIEPQQNQEENLITKTGGDILPNPDAQQNTISFNNGGLIPGYDGGGNIPWNQRSSVMTDQSIPENGELYDQFAPNREDPLNLIRYGQRKTPDWVNYNFSKQQGPETEQSFMNKRIANPVNNKYIYRLNDKNYNNILPNSISNNSPNNIVNAPYIQDGVANSAPIFNDESKTENGNSSLRTTQNITASNDLGKNSKNNQSNSWRNTNTALTGLGLAAPLVNVGRGIFEKVDLLNANDYINTSKISAPKMNVNPQLNEVRNQAIANRNALKSQGAQAFMSGMGTVSSGVNNATGQIYAQKHNVDAENQMKADVYNASSNKDNNENKLKVEMINRAAKGAKDQMLTTGLSQLSQFGQGYLSDRMMLESGMSVNPNYEYDSKTGRHKVKNSDKGAGEVSISKDKEPKSNNGKLNATGGNNNINQNTPVDNTSKNPYKSNKEMWEAEMIKRGAKKGSNGKWLTGPKYKAADKELKDLYGKDWGNDSTDDIYNKLYPQTKSKGGYILQNNLIK